MSYELAIIQNYSSDEHNLINSSNLPGFYSIKKTLWNLFSEDNNTVDDFIDRYNQIILHRNMDYRITNSNVNIPYLAIIYKYSYNGSNFLRDKTYLLIILQRNIKKYLGKKAALLKSPLALFYREIQGKYPSYNYFYSGKFRINR